MNAKRWIALVIAVVVVFVSWGVSFAMSLFTQNFESVFSNIAEQEYFETVIEEGDSLDKIVVLDVEGVILDSGKATSLLGQESYNHQLFLTMLTDAMQDESVKGVVLSVNSPGGGVMESAEIHHKIVQLKKEYDKPIYVSMGSMAASGGYYISAPADKIFATKETLTGSLGVIMSGYNVAGLQEKLGIKDQTIKSGPHKDIMSSNREMTEEERQIMQSMINNSYDGFVKVISEGRKMSEEQVRQIADGRIYDGIQAKEINLIDDFGYLEDVTAAMKKDVGDESLSVVHYGQTATFSSLFSAKANKLLGKEDDAVTKFLQSVASPSSPRLMYLYTE
ncbi:signal peptide peptidase SppA [Massilibacterium senegalense]|uniref:signal peptide peptidase SppA n=1 Tax=Massilibacterium senegalense TaxID=1632858 RepID=UPI0007858EA6|nr:signal peptide peptidase SppA [Massilibacterium senegalense]